MFDVTAFGAMLKRKRGEMRLTQETLALDVFGDSARKADISRLENGKVPNPQEATIQKLCKALNISVAEMEPIRQSRITAAQLDQIPTLSREELQNIAARFQIENAFERPDADLRKLLTMKAQEYRALKTEVDAISDDMKRLANLKSAAQDAIARVDLDEVEHLLGLVHATELEEAAKTAELRATNALLRGDIDRAFVLLSAAADSFAAADPLEPAERRLRYDGILYAHGLRYGGTGMARSETMIRQAIADIDQNQAPQLWARAQNNLAIALQNQGTRTEGEKGADLLAQAVTAYRAALEVRTRDDHPVDWAMTQNNLGIALQNQGIRTEGKKGADLLAQAVTAYRAALEVCTRNDHPVQWAMTQNNLAIALQNQGSRTEGEKGANLLAQAVIAYRAALEVRTRDDHPVQWAMTQNNLGGALGDQGTRTEGEKCAELLAQAVTAYRATLEVRTRDDRPVQWAMTQENIAVAHLEIAGHDSCADRIAQLDAALTAVDAALTVYDPINMSYDHGTATRLRDKILDRLTP